MELRKKVLVSSLMFGGAILLGLPLHAGTLADMQSAYNGETNANAKYTMYAEKAESDGYNQVARLFRAVAKSEEIHAANHAKIIKKLGGAPSMTLQEVQVGSTLENLKDALKGETYEKDSMYPAYITQAKKEGKSEAVRSLNNALSAEKQHAIFFAAAIDNIETMKMVTKNYYVCPVCGGVYDDSAIEKCQICRTLKKQFLTIS